MKKIIVWMYRNDNGDQPLLKLTALLKAHGMQVFCDFDMGACHVLNGEVFTSCGVNLSGFDCLYHMNADEQTDHQADILRAISDSNVSVINDCRSYFYCQDKFRTNNLLRRSGFCVPDAMLLAKGVGRPLIDRVFKRWRALLVKPRTGHGAKGIIKFTDPEQFYDWLEGACGDTSSVYIERFVEFADKDFRVEVFNGEVLGGYSRRRKHSYKTNISSGGEMTPANIRPYADLAVSAAKVLGVTGTVIDMVDGTIDGRTYILEVNPLLGIFVESAMMAGTKMIPKKAHPSYAYDDKKIEKIAHYIISCVSTKNDEFSSDSSHHD